MDGDGALSSGDCLQSRADPEREAVSHTASDHKRNRLKRGSPRILLNFIKGKVLNVRTVFLLLVCMCIKYI